MRFQSNTEVSYMKSLTLKYIMRQLAVCCGTLSTPTFTVLIRWK